MPKTLKNKNRNKKTRSKKEKSPRGRPGVRPTDEHKHMMMNRLFDSPPKNPSGTPSTRRRCQEEIIHKYQTVSKIKLLTVLNQQICASCGVFYTLEAIAHILLAKKIKSIQKL